MDSTIIKPHQYILERFMIYWLNLILKSDQGLFLRQIQILRSTGYKNLQKQSNKDFFTRLLNSCLHFPKNNYTILMHLEKILKQPIILDPHTKLSFSFYSIPPKKYYIQKQIYHTQRLLQIYLQPGLIFPTQDLKRNWVVILNDWKSKFRKETSQKSLSKIFYFTTAVPRK